MLFHCTVDGISRRHAHASGEVCPQLLLPRRGLVPLRSGFTLSARVVKARVFRTLNAYHDFFEAMWD